MGLNGWILLRTLIQLEHLAVLIMVNLSSKQVPENHVFQNSLSLFKTSTLYNINRERVVKKLKKDLHLDSHSWLTSWLAGRQARCPSGAKEARIFVVIFFIHFA